MNQNINTFNHRIILKNMVRIYILYIIHSYVAYLSKLISNSMQKISVIK